MSRRLVGSGLGIHVVNPTPVGARNMKSQRSVPLVNYEHFAFSVGRDETLNGGEFRTNRRWVPRVAQTGVRVLDHAVTEAYLITQKLQHVVPRIWLPSIPVREASAGKLPWIVNQFSTRNEVN